MQIHDFFSNKIINYKTLSYDILIGLYVHQECSQKGDSGCASEKLGVPHLLSD